MNTILQARAELKSHNGYYLWNYVPSQAASIIFLIIFLALTLLTTWRMIRSKTWFASVLVIGGFFEVVGFAARAKAYNETDQIMPYVIQNIFILLAPALFAATIYMTLGRIIRMLHAEHLSPIRVGRLTKLFVMGDLLSMWCQSLSTPLVFIADGKYSKWGGVLVLFGLFCQIVSFGLFWGVAVMFRMRIRSSPTETSLSTGGTWRPLIRMLYYVSGLVMVRSVFRIVEYGETVVTAFSASATATSIGYLQLHEWPMYVFDPVLMAFVMFFFFWWFPQGLQNQELPGCETELIPNCKGHDNESPFA